MVRSGALLALGLLVGCTGGTPIGTDNTIPTGPLPKPTTEEPTADTGTEPLDLGPFSPDLFELNAFFAFDEKAVRFSNYAIPDQGLAPIAFGVTFYDIARNLGCRVLFQIDGAPTESKWVDKQGAWVGLDVPDDATIVNGCEGYEFPDLFEDQEEGVLFHVRKWDWAFGLGQLDPDVSDGLMNSVSPAQWAAIQPFLIGGFFYSNTFADADFAVDGYTDIGTAIGYEVDGNFQIDTDGTGNAIPIPRERVNLPDGVATGYYEADLLLNGAGALTNPAPK